MCSCVLKGGGWGGGGVGEIQAASLSCVQQKKGYRTVVLSMGAADDGDVEPLHARASINQKE